MFLGFKFVKHIILEEKRAVGVRLEVEMVYMAENLTSFAFLLSFHFAFENKNTLKRFIFLPIVSTSGSNAGVFLFFLDRFDI